MNNCLKLWLLFSISKGMVPFTFFRDSAISDLRFFRFYLCWKYFDSSIRSSLVTLVWCLMRPPCLMQLSFKEDEDEEESIEFSRMSSFFEALRWLFFFFKVFFISIRATFSLRFYLTDLALCANFIEERVSWRQCIEGLRVMMIWVREFPPKPSFKMWVSFESL